ncbi:VanR-ABDEGLN family response regulator transcription factor [Clostridium sp.]|uniref:VanR-ABDEGLN family response regulator transcription factor n=1 Tax=Clostridium sp. TaxID=1506 RepID=UPI003F3481EF
MSLNILVLDDEKEIADLLEIYLKNENYSVFKFYCVADALECIENKHIDLAILDVMLPDGDGFDMCQKIRNKHLFPVIMLTAKDSEKDKIIGLTFGADDYITKPFRPLEVMARVKAQLRRYIKYNEAEEIVNNGVGDKEHILVHRDLRINLKTHQVHLGEKLLSLTPTEFIILQVLCKEDGNVVSSEQLFHKIWGDEYYDKNNNTIATHIRHLREKLNDSVGDPKYIKTVWGVGYKLEK